MATVQMLVSFVVVLGILIIVHELGHFLMARLCGVGVERFSIGFGPVLWRFRGKETEYCLSLIPMGGYVKMMGDDENPLEGGKAATVDPARAFNNKPLAARFLIVFAGPAMNFVLAVLIAAAMFTLVGRPVAPAEVGRVTEGGPAAQAGLRTGDRVVAVDGKPVQYWEDLARVVQAASGRPLEVTVQGSDAASRKVALTPAQAKRKDLFGDEQTVWEIGASPYLAPAIGDVIPGDPAAQAGLKAGDVVVALEGQPVMSWDELAEKIHQRAGQPTRLEAKRGTETVTITVTPKKGKVPGPDGKEMEVGLVGIRPGGATMMVRSNPVSAMWEGLAWSTDVTVKTGIGLYKIVVGQLDRSNIGGPIQIAKTAGEQARQGLVSLALFTAVISINLFLLNLLPVPMLDGGHLLFFAFEAVLGRPLSVRKREVAQQVGFALLMLLMVFAFYNDFKRIGLF
ncbi:MAG TPA: RIP metalloprotease RseP [Methylomirabilota bacterium]|nr:RIP metalloprotease RseP [Methylomirabilota bacterium]